ncbi:MAG: hypothetical protein R3C60_00360 [Parvularculaceae bacterium]
MGFLARIFPWIGGLFISGVFLDSLRFKFTGHPTPRHIFTTLRDWSGIDLFYPAGPWIIGSAELTASLLLIGLPVIFLLTKNIQAMKISQWFGAGVAFVTMSGAIFFHLFTPLSIYTPIEWSADGTQILKQAPSLFIAACISWVCALIIGLIRMPAGLGLLRR